MNYQPGRILMMLGVVVAAIVAFLMICWASVRAATISTTSPDRATIGTHTQAGSDSVYDALALPGLSVASRLPAIANNDVISTVGGIIQQIIEARVYFPAKTFQDAVEKAARAVFQAELAQLREPLVTVVRQVMFGGIALWGNAVLPPPVQDLGRSMADAAIPLWALSLSLMGLAVLTRNAVGLGYGSNDVAGEAVRWLFIAFASANGMALVNLAHNGFAALSGAVLALGAPDPSQIVGALLPGVFDTGPSNGAGAIPLLILVPGMIIALVTVVVLALTHIARYALMMAVTGLGPLAIACEGIPFTRFVFHDWISMFLRLELLGVVNTFILVMFARLNEFNLTMGGSFGGLGWGLISLVVMVGLASAIIGVNLSVFQQVFGVAIAAAQQVKAAGDQMMRAVGAIAGVAVTASTGLPIPLGPVTSAPDTTSGTPSGSTGTAAGVMSGISGGSTTRSETASRPGSIADGSGADAAMTAGSVARALGSTTGNPLLQGFGAGSALGQSLAAQHTTAQRLSEQRAQSVLRRAEQLAREVGGVETDDVSAIASSIIAPDGGVTPDQMRHAHQENAPLLRSMARQYGSPARAAAVGGFDNFAQMANAMARERLGAENTTANSSVQRGTLPLSRWMANEPSITDPGSQNMLPYDFSAGATINQAVGGSPGNAPQWARTAYSLRRAYGASYVRQLAEHAQAHGLTEREAMSLVDNQVESTASESPIFRFWMADTH
ncbi:MAG: hypothetical protein M1546_21810 [Chloroflexi bacterium]|nr:hypothetical protein [Chloroflexota bacterium]